MMEGVWRDEPGSSSAVGTQLSVFAKLLNADGTDGKPPPGDSCNQIEDVAGSHG